MEDYEKLQSLLYRTENNIDFYLEENKPNSALNEIGCMRGILYAWEAITGYDKKLTNRELSYIKLQQELKEVDNANNIDQIKWCRNGSP